MENYRHLTEMSDLRLAIQKNLFKALMESTKKDKTLSQYHLNSLS